MAASGQLVAEVLPARFAAFMPFERFNKVQSALADVAFQEDANLLVSAPTGCGKTAVFDLALLRTLASGQAAKVLYLAPMRALCQERYDDWRERGNTLSLKVVLLTGDSEWDTGAMQRLRAAHVIVATPEKFDSFTRTWQDNLPLLGSIGCVCIDEVHCVGEERGPSLEAVVARLHLLRDAPQVQQHGWPAANLRVCAVSATMGDPSSLAAWLRVHPDNVLQAGEELRPVPLTVHVKGVLARAGNGFLDERTIVHRHVAATVRDYSGGSATLVFCATKSGATEAASALAKTLPRMLLQGAEHRARLQMEARRLADAKLAELVSRGSAFHHGGLTASDRSAVERLFRDGFVAVVCSTSTLSLGVNLPAHLVVIAGTQQYCGASEGYKNYPASTVTQMIGRAGRPGKDEHGVAVILTHECYEAHWQRMHQGIITPRSGMLGELIIARYLNAEIAAGTVRTLPQAQRWWRGTLGYQQADSAPETASTASAAPFASPQLGRQLAADEYVHTALQHLVQSGCVITGSETSPGFDVQIDSQLNATAIGRTAGQQYMHIQSLQTMLAWLSHGQVQEEPAPGRAVVQAASLAAREAGVPDTRGRAWACCAWAMYSATVVSAHHVVHGAVRQLLPVVSTRHAAWLVCHTPDVMGIAAIKRGDKQLLNAMNKQQVPITLGAAAHTLVLQDSQTKKKARVAAGTVKSAAHKAFLLLQMALNRTPIENLGLRNTAKAVCETVARVASAFERTMRSLPGNGSVLALVFAELQRCAQVQAWSDTPFPLLQLLRIGQVNCAKMADAGIVSLRDMQSVTDDDLKAALGGAVPRWAQEARARLASTPRLDMSAPELCRVDDAGLTVMLHVECADGVEPEPYRAQRRRIWRPWKLTVFEQGQAGVLVSKCLGAAGGIVRVQVPASAVVHGKVELHVALLHRDLVGLDARRTFLIETGQRSHDVGTGSSSTIQHVVGELAEHSSSVARLTTHAAASSGSPEAPPAPKAAPKQRGITNKDQSISRVRGEQGQPKLVQSTLGAMRLDHADAHSANSVLVPYLRQIPAPTFQLGSTDSESDTDIEAVAAQAASAQSLTTPTQLAAFSADTGGRDNLLFTSSQRSAAPFQTAPAQAGSDGSVRASQAVSIQPTADAGSVRAQAIMQVLPETLTATQNKNLRPDATQTATLLAAHPRALRQAGAARASFRIGSLARSQSAKNFRLSASQLQLPRKRPNSYTHSIALASSAGSAAAAARCSPGTTPSTGMKRARLAEAASQQQRFLPRASPTPNHARMSQASAKSFDQPEFQLSGGADDQQTVRARLDAQLQELLNW